MSDTPIIDKLIQELCQRVYQPTAAEIVPLERIKQLAIEHLGKFISHNPDDRVTANEWSARVKLVEDIRDICNQAIHQAPTAPAEALTPFRCLTDGEIGVLYTSLCNQKFTDPETISIKSTCIRLLLDSKLVFRTD